jgi:hypothetical protein
MSEGFLEAENFLFFDVLSRFPSYAVFPPIGARIETIVVQYKLSEPCANLAPLR